MCQRFFRIGVVIFCVWHMFAVSVFAMPRVAEDEFSRGVRQVFLPVVTPYMDITSQWQLWNLFAPDPTRQFSVYRIETKQADQTWKEVVILQPSSYPWWRRATYMKYMMNIFDAPSDAFIHTKEHFLHLQCVDHDLPGGTVVRLVAIRTLVTGKNEPTETVILQSLCPSTPLP